MISAILLYSSLVLSQPKAIRLARQASAAIYSQSGVELNITVKRRRDIRPPVSPNDSALISEYSHILPSDPRLVIIVAPPSRTPEGYEVLKGMALVCSRRAVLTYLSSTHPVIQRANFRTLLHEIGHALGAQHSDDASVMSPIITQSLEFNATSISEIRACSLQP